MSAILRGDSIVADGGGPCWWNSFWSTHTQRGILHSLTTTYTRGIRSALSSRSTKTFFHLFAVLCDSYVEKRNGVIPQADGNPDNTSDVNLLQPAGILPLLEISTCLTFWTNGINNPVFCRCLPSPTKLSLKLSPCSYRSKPGQRAVDLLKGLN